MYSFMLNKNVDILQAVAISLYKFPLSCKSS